MSDPKVDFVADVETATARFDAVHERYTFNPDWVVAPGETLREWRESNQLPAKAAATACARMPLLLYLGVEEGTERIDERIAAGLAHGTNIPATLWLNLERIFRAGLAAGKTWDVASPDKGEPHRTREESAAIGNRLAAEAARDHLRGTVWGAWLDTALASPDKGEPRTHDSNGGDRG